MSTAAEPSCVSPAAESMSATATGRKSRRWTEGHRNNQRQRSDCRRNHFQKSAFHNHLTSSYMARA
jgi:hypothetical protein